MRSLISDLGAAAVLICAVTQLLNAEGRHVELQLIDRTQLPDEVLITLRREVQQVWSSELVLEWTAQAVDPRSSSRGEHLYVVLCGREAARPRYGAIAAIMFLGADPLNQIRAYPSEAQRLLEADPAFRYLGQPLKARYQAMGRVLGRAVAHEIGHYIRKSRQHEAVGLMRASHAIAALAGADHSPFSIAGLLNEPGTREVIAADCSLSLMPGLGATPP